VSKEIESLECELSVAHTRMDVLDREIAELKGTIQSQRQLIEELAVALEQVLSTHTGPNLNEEGRKYRACRAARLALATYNASKGE